MQINSVTELGIEGAKLIEFDSFPDKRGYFTEPYRESQLQEVICGFRCVQVNQSYSETGVLRGLHWQTHSPMGKLVRVLEGWMYDLLLDVRTYSKTFGTRLIVPIEDHNTWIWVPSGVAHGNFFPVKSKIEYLCTAEYNKVGEYAINPLSVFDLDEFGFDSCVISDKDMAAPTFEQWKAQQ